MSRLPRKIFNAEEKQLIINFIKNNKHIIENKNNDFKLIREKKQKWDELSQIFAVKGYERDPQRLREYYHRMKCNAKQVIQAYQKHIGRTGNLPSHQPSEVDWAIYEIAPDDFNSGESEENHECVSPKKENSNDVSYLVEPNEGSINGNVQNESSSDIQQLEQPGKRKRRYSLSSNRDEFLKKTKSESLPYGFIQIANIELQFLKQKQKLDVALHKEKLENLRQQHYREMENIDLHQQKLQTEIEAVSLWKKKLNIELEKVNLELAMIKEKNNFQSESV